MSYFGAIAKGSAVAAFFLLSPDAWAGNSFHLDIGTDSPNEIGAALKIVAVLTALSLAPALLLTTTSFVRIMVVLSLLRTALGTQTTPPQQVIIGLALFLTMAVMWPVGTVAYETGLNPYLEGQLPAKAAFTEGVKPIRQFMLQQTREEDLLLFYDISGSDLPETPETVAMHLLVPSFVISELRTAFEMGFMLFIPFLLLDMVVAAITMSLGMVMLPPALISMPIKLMLFVLVDGWNLITGSLVRSFA